MTEPESPTYEDGSGDLFFFQEGVLKCDTGNHEYGILAEEDIQAFVDFLLMYKEWKEQQGKT